MGKLHTLRRSIERDPDIWYRVYSKDYVNVHGVVKYKPQRGHYKPDPYFSKSYRQFVASVLIDLEIIRVGSRNGRRVLMLQLKPEEVHNAADDEPGS